MERQIKSDLNFLYKADKLYFLVIKYRGARCCFVISLLITLLILSYPLKADNLLELSVEDLKHAEQFYIGNLRAAPKDLTNRVVNKPAAIQLGRVLFFDEKLSANSLVSCATCHIPEKNFQDNRKVAFGLDSGLRRTMPIEGAQWAPWLFWDGRKDSLWSQALGPLEDQKEHGATRSQLAVYVLKNYGFEYRSVFPAEIPDFSAWPERASPIVPGDASDNWMLLSAQTRHQINTVFANIGKMIAAYEGTLLPQVNRFDLYIESKLAGMRSNSELLSVDELDGFRLFVGKAKCDSCHQGPRFTDDFFHNTGIPNSEGRAPDLGRFMAMAKVVADPFNCKGKYSDALPKSCEELEYMQKDARQFIGAFKTPSLRAVSSRSPYMHAGQYASLKDVVAHYVTAPDSFAGSVANYNNPYGRVSEIQPVILNEKEQAQLVAFLKTL
jgi:cytochrome c peroxidase